jgi:hypothetical protein
MSWVLSSRVTRRRRRSVAAATLAVLATWVCAGGAFGQAPGEDPANDISIAAQAPPGECWVGPPFGQQPLPIADDGTCPNGGKARINEDYLWGFSKDDDEKNLWFGTAPNVACTGMGIFFPSLSAAGLNTFQPFDSDELTCEFDHSWLHDQGNPIAAGPVGDARVGKIRQYNIASGTLTDRTPVDDELYSKVAGIRAAGGLNGVMFLAGIETDINGGTQGGGTVAMFAFDQKTGAFLGSHEFPEFANVKNFKVLDGQLYVGMNLTTARDNPAGGHPINGEVLKWTGDRDDPFTFEDVGDLGGQPAYFEVAEGRIVATTWVGTGQTEPAAVYVSPPLADRPDGLTGADVGGWTKLFDASQYYPDSITALNQYGMGAQEYDGWLYFSISTVGVGASTLAHLVAYPQLRRDNLYALGLNYLRSEPAASVFRMKNLGRPDQTIQLLYGNEKYWSFDPSAGADGRWKYVPNRLGQRARFGPGGFGNPLGRLRRLGHERLPGQALHGRVQHDQSPARRRAQSGPGPDRRCDPRRPRDGPERRGAELLATHAVRQSPDRA